jgi:hypothetical protein
VSELLRKKIKWYLFFSHSLLKRKNILYYRKKPMSDSPTNQTVAGVKKLGRPRKEPLSVEEQKDRARGYRIKHKESMRNALKAWRASNKDHINEYNAKKGVERFHCQLCNRSVLYFSKSKHLTSRSHLLVQGILYSSLEKNSSNCTQAEHQSD